MYKPPFEGDQRTIGYVLDDRVKKYPDKVFGYITGETITYAQLGERVNRVANSLLDLGIKKGDIVSIMMSNCPEYIYTWFALGKIGAVEAVVNTAFKGDLLEYFINYNDTSVAVVDEDLVERFYSIQDSLGGLKKIIVRKLSTFAGNIPDTKFEIIPYEDLLKGSSEDPKVERPCYTDTLTIMYTSGTTGKSKGVLCSHNHCYTAASYYIEALGLTPEDTIYNCLPLFHMAGAFLAVQTALVLGTTIAMVESFSASRFWDDIRKYKATVFNCFGSMFPILWMLPEREDDADVPVRIMLAIPARADIERAFEKRFNLKIIQGFGSTEMNCVVLTPLNEEAPVGSVGKPLPHSEIKLVDENDNEVPTGVRGEFVYRPKKPHIMMSGYYKRPEATAEAFRNLWYHTGDYGKKDENGFYYFVDRKKDCMRRRGENISAAEVETVVNKYPGVAESAASGVWAELGEEDVKISIILQDGAAPIDPVDLMRFCEEKLPWYAVPRYVEFRSDLPRTPTAKVARYKIKEEGVHDNLWDREAAGYKIKKR
ncbi:MAG: ATP-dependent acyl-CoA ligase [Syntrophales bacterium]